MSDIATPGAPVVAAATTEIYNDLGAPFAEFGAGDAFNGYPLLRFLDGIGQLLQRGDDLSFDDLSTGAPGWSVLLDPTRCPAYALPWLAQFVGVRFDPESQVTAAAQRQALLAEQPWQRGTVAAIQAAAAQWLQAGQQALVYERDTGPYHFSVVLRLGALAPATFAQTAATYPTFADRTAARSTFATPAYPQAQVAAAITGAKPAGLTYSLSIVAGPTFAQTLTGLPTFADRLATVPTFADISNWS